MVNDNRTNITEDRLKNLEGITLEKTKDNMRMKVDDKWVFPVRNKYMFAPIEEDPIYLNIPAPAGKGIRVYLNGENYDQLNEELSNKLTNIVATVNDAHEYDFGACVRKQIKPYEQQPARSRTTLNKDIATMLEYAPDISNPDAPKIICTGSTDLIADELERANIPKLYWKVGSAIKKNGIHHSVVFVFDNKGKWVLLNGKTPANNYTIIPKSSLDNDVERVC